MMNRHRYIEQRWLREITGHAMRWGCWVCCCNRWLSSWHHWCRPVSPTLIILAKYRAGILLSYINIGCVWIAFFCQPAVMKYAWAGNMAVWQWTNSKQAFLYLVLLGSLIAFRIKEYGNIYKRVQSGLTRTSIGQSLFKFGHSGYWVWFVLIIWTKSIVCGLWLLCIRVTFLVWS